VPLEVTDIRYIFKGQKGPTIAKANTLPVPWKTNWFGKNAGKILKEGTHYKYTSKPSCKTCPTATELNQEECCAADHKYDLKTHSCVLAYTAFPGYCKAPTNNFKHIEMGQVGKQRLCNPDLSNVPCYGTIIGGTAKCKDNCDKTANCDAWGFYGGLCYMYGGETMNWGKGTPGPGKCFVKNKT